MFQMFYPVSCCLCPLDKMDSPRDIFDSLKIAKLARFLGLYHSLCYGQWSRKNCICPRQVKQIKICHFWWSFKRFIIHFVGDFVLGKMASPRDFFENCHKGKVFLVYHSKCNGQVLEMISFTTHLLMVLIGGSFLLPLNQRPQMFMGWSLDTWLERVIDTRTRRDVFIIQFINSLTWHLVRG